jgi:TusA-related sulfurtransferase
VTGEPAFTVDATGLRCPMPVLELARRVSAQEPAPGTLVALLSDDPSAAADVPAWCGMRGHELVGSGPAGPDGVTRYLVRLSG